MQILLNGLVSGAAIAMLAIGFQVTYLPTRTFFLALGGIYTITPYVARAVLSLGLGWTLAAISAIGVSIFLALICEWLNHAPLARKGASEGAHLIASLGVNIILVQVVALIWGNESQTLRNGPDVVFHFIKTLILTRAQVWILCISALIISTYTLVLMRSDLGLRLRTLADNPILFALSGHNVDHYRLLSFGLSGFFAALASLMTANDVGFDPHGGLSALLLAVAAVIIGGRGGFLGPVLGAVLLGLLRAAVVWFASARWQEAATFVLLGLFLLLRPNGLLGRKLRLEATQ